MTEREPESASTVSRHVRIAIAAVVVGLVAWFFFSWLAQGKPVLDAAGESVGSGLLLLVIVSIAGMIVRRG